MLLALLAPTFAATWTVNPSGSGDFTTISDAVAAAAEGDEVDISAGVYVEDVALGGKSLVLVGAGSDSTWISGSGTALDARGSTSLTVRDIGIDSAARGLDATGLIELSDVVFEDVGTGTEKGSAIRVEGGVLDWEGGGIHGSEAADGSVYVSLGSAVFVDVEVFDTSADLGSAIYAVDSAIEVMQSDFIGGASTGSGGLVHVEGGSFSAVQVTFVDGEVSVASSAGCLCTHDTALVLSEVDFSNCQSTRYSGSPGALTVEGGSLEIQDSSFDGSVGTAYGDMVASDCSVLITGTSFENPKANDCSSGGGSSYLWPHGRDAVLDDITLALPYTSGCASGFNIVGAANAAIGDVTLTARSSGRTDSDLTVYADVATFTGTFSAGANDGSVYLVSPAFSIGPLVASASTATAGGYGGGEIHDVTGTLSYLTARNNAGDIAIAELVLEDSILYLSQYLSGVTVASNLDLDGGGIAIQGGTVSLVDVQVQNAPSSAIYTAGTATVELENIHVENSTAGRWGTTASTAGGAIFVGYGSAVTLFDGYFAGNAAGVGGAIAIESGSLDMQAAVFKENAGDSGGAIWVNGGNLSVENAVFQQNSADEGAAVYVGSGYPELSNVTAVANQASGGGSMHVEGGYLELTNAIVAADTAGSGLDADSSTSGSYSDLSYNDVYDNATGEYTGYFADLTGSDGNISADATFVSFSNDGNAENDDLHLSSASPCVDAGDPRISDADGSTSDIGAFGGTFSGAFDYDGDGQSPDDGDCDDVNASVYADADERCDGVDNDCDGTADEAGATGETTWYADLDGDGFGSDDTAVEACDLPSGYAAVAGDCAAGDAIVNPGATEIAYDGIDNDCAAGTPDDDLDGDGFPRATDCDDADPAAYPGAPETSDDGVDQDCDGADSVSPPDTGEPFAADTGDTALVSEPVDTAPGDTANPAGLDSSDTAAGPETGVDEPGDTSDTETDLPDTAAADSSSGMPDTGVPPSGDTASDTSDSTSPTGDSGDSSMDSGDADTAPTDSADTEADSAATDSAETDTADTAETGATDSGDTVAMDSSDTGEGAADSKASPADGNSTSQTDCSGCERGPGAFAGVMLMFAAFRARKPHPNQPGSG